LASPLPPLYLAEAARKVEKERTNKKREKA